MASYFKRQRFFFSAHLFFIISYMLKSKKKSLPLKIICRMSSSD